MTDKNVNKDSMRQYMSVQFSPIAGKALLFEKFPAFVHLPFW
jgi:hypothetical protein